MLTTTPPKLKSQAVNPESPKLLRLLSPVFRASAVAEASVKVKDR